MNKNNSSTFSTDFLWGASSSAYQCEGAYLDDGKQLSVQDVPNLFLSQMLNTAIPCADFKVAVNHYYLFEDDIALMAQMGLKAYRFSIAWSRIYPNGVNLNSKGIEHYKRVFDCLRKHHIEPIVTIYHFDLPLALEKQGGWTNRELILNAWERYVKTLFSEFKNDVKYWLTINEQNMATMVDLIGTLKNQSDLKSVLQKIVNKNHHMFLANALAIEWCHQICPQAKIGPAPSVSVTYPKTCDPRDTLAAHNLASFFHFWYLDTYVFGEQNQSLIGYFHDFGIEIPMNKNDEAILKAAKPDFLAFNYYSTITASYQPDTKQVSEFALSLPNFASMVNNEHLAKTNYNWAIDPLGFRLTFMELYDRYRLPLLVTENGLGTQDQLTSDFKVHDHERIQYLRSHIEQMRTAYQMGIPIIGYCPWSAFDLVSTHNGISKRYGLIYVNRTETDLKDLKRYPKDSFYWYQKVIKTNGEDLN